MANKKNDSKETQAILLELPADMKKKVKMRARALDLTMAQYIRALLRDDLKPNKAA